MSNRIFPSRKRIKTHGKCRRNHVEIPKPKVTPHLDLRLGMTSSTLVGAGLSPARPDHRCVRTSRSAQRSKEVSAVLLEI